MNYEKFLRQGKWLTSFALFGHRQFVTHHPISFQGEIATIKRTELNPSYPAQQHLAENISKQIYGLVKSLNQRKQNQNELKMYYLRSIMQCIVKAADNGTESYHNVLYLTFSFLAYIVSRDAVKNSKRIDDEINLYNWLADIHAIYFSEKENNANDEISNESLLLTLLKKGDYEQMVSILRIVYCNLGEGQECTLEKIDIIITLLLHKLYDLTQEMIIGDQELQNKNNKKIIQNLRNKFNKISNKSSKKKVDKKAIKIDTYEFIGQILLGKQSSIQHFSQKSWPIYLMNQHNLHQIIYQSIEADSLVHKYIKRVKDYGRATQKQTQYFLLLVSESNPHLIYQALLEIVPPYYAHLIAYFFDIIQPNPIPNVYEQDYTLDIIRDLLYHSSQISFECLIYNFAILQQINFCQRRNQIFQTLLVHHLVVIDTQDREEINDFLRKVKILVIFNLQSYAYSQLNILLNKILRNGSITREVLLIYGNCCVLFGHLYNYEELLSYYLDGIYTDQLFNLCFLKEYEELNQQLSNSQDRKLKTEILKIEPFFDKYYLFSTIIQQKDRIVNFKNITELMQKTYRSLKLLQLLLDNINNILDSAKHQGNTEVQLNGFDHQKWFLNSVKQFIIHYPAQCGKQEEAVIKVICSMIS